MNNNTDKTRWHRILAGMFKELLTPLNITVLPDVRIMTDPPKIDILLIRRETPPWTDEQLMRLPDGIRDTRADHILIEFKFTESVNRNALNQAVAYEREFDFACKKRFNIFNGLSMYVSESLENSGN